MTDILVSEAIVGQALERLKGQFSVRVEPDLWRQGDALLEAVASCRALIVRNQTQVSAAVIGTARQLLVIGRAGVGLENLDLDAASKAGIVVAWTPEQNAVSVAELAIGLILSLARRIPAADRHVRAGGWDRIGHSGVELHGKTLGVLGLGRIGFLTALRAQVFGMDIIAHDKYLTSDALPVVQLRARLTSLDSVLAESDFVTCHLPSSDQTRGCLSYERFCQMKPTACFVNTSRGDVVDQSGLIRALKEQRIAAAALDVQQHEPPQTCLFDQMDNVVLTPHIGAFTSEAQQRVVASICRDVAAVLRGQAATYFVNFATPRRTC